MPTYGYHGRIITIDLTRGAAAADEPGETFWRTYGGGGLLATAFLLRYCRPGGDALAPDNPLVVCSSVAAGHPYPGLARFTVAARSPLSGGVGEARCEGPFGQALKAGGAEALVFTGAAERPAVALLEGGRVTLHPAEHLWGLTVGETADRLAEQFGPDIHTAIIGPAGERLVRFASIVSDRSHQAARTGLGAVMGAKKLKAIVVRGGALPPVADAAALDALAASYAARMRENVLTTWQLDPPGFGAWVHTHGIDAALCTRNYRDSVFESAEAYRPELFLQRLAGLSACPGCPNDCIKRYAVPGADARAGGMHQEITGALGSNLGVADLDALFEANRLCNELGMDPNSLGFTLSMAMECVERGILSEAAAGPGVRFGDAAALPDLVRRVGLREGFGDVLAEGARRAAERIGGGAERLALHVKGIEMVPFEPRTQTNLALGYATAPFGPRYDVCEHDWDYDTRVGWAHTLDHSRTLGIVERVPMEELSAAKVRNFKALSTLWSGADALGMCIFAIAPTRVYSLHEMAALLAGVTGWDTSAYEIMRYGERRLHLMRVFNLREGLGAADDTLPARFFEDPIPEGAWAGTKLDRAAFDDAVRTYYRMMGWDDAGRPRYETLLDHQLAWAVDEGHAPRV